MLWTFKNLYAFIVVSICYFNQAKFKKLKSVLSVAFKFLTPAIIAKNFTFKIATPNTTVWIKEKLTLLSHTTTLKFDWSYHTLFSIKVINRRHFWLISSSNENIFSKNLRFHFLCLALSLKFQLCFGILFTSITCIHTKSLYQQILVY